MSKPKRYNKTARNVDRQFRKHKMSDPRKVSLLKAIQARRFKAAEKRETKLKHKRIYLLEAKPESCNDVIRATSKVPKPIQQQKLCNI